MPNFKLLQTALFVISLLLFATPAISKKPVKGPKIEEGQLFEKLHSDKKRVFYTKCAAAEDDSYECAPKTKKVVFVTFETYKEKLRSLFKPDIMEKNLKKYRAAEYGIKRLPAKLGRLVEIAESKLASAKRADSRKSTEETAAELTKRSKALEGLRTKLFKATTAKKEYPEKLARYEKLLKSTNKYINSLLAVLKFGSIHVNQKLLWGNSRAFVPFRYTEKSCQKGQTWKDGDEAVHGYCCTQNYCVHSMFKKPTCKLSVNGKAFRGNERIFFNVETDGGPTSYINFFSKKYAVTKKKTTLAQAIPNKSKEIKKGRYQAQVIGPGGDSFCTTEFELFPDCPSTFIWDASHLCCMKWLRCNCNHLSPDGLRYACKDRDKVIVDAKCFTKDEEHQRNVCAPRDLY